MSWVGSSRAWRLASAAILLVLLFGNIRLILGTETPQSAASDFFGPQFSLTADFAKHGHLLRWDPWIAGGTPDFAEPELGTTSPLVLLIGLVSPNPQAGFIAYWLVLWAIGGIGMLCLTRYLGSPAWGGLIVALGYVTSGFYTANAEHTSSICSIAFVPWIVWRFDKAIQTGTYWPSIQSGVLHGLSALGGDPVFTILTPGFLLLWGTGRALLGTGSAQRLRRFGRMLLLAGLIVIVGSLICSPPYAGFLKDTHGYSDRVEFRDRNQSVGSNILPAGALTTFASPFLGLLNQTPNPIRPVSDISKSNVYMGAVAFAFAILALRRKQAWRLWLLFIALLFGCCALGDQWPLRGWLYDYVPYFRAHLILVLGVLAAYAARDLLSRDEVERATKRLFSVSLALAAVSVAVFFMVSRRKSAMPPEFHFAIAHLLIVWCGLAILAYLLWKRPSRRAPLFRFLALLALADAWGTLSIGRSTISTRATQPWWAVMKSHHVRTLGLSTTGVNRVPVPPALLGGSENNRNLPLKIATFNNVIVFANRFHRLIAGDPSLEKMALGADRFWFSAKPSWTAPTGAAFQMFRHRMHELGVPPLLLHPAADMSRLSAQDADPPGSIRGPVPPERCLQARISQVSYHPDSLAFHYIAPSAGWLMITDRWAPGWQATVNGRPRQVQGADFIFRAVQVDAGDNQVAFGYKPPGQLFYLAISWSTLVAFLACEIRRRWRRDGSGYKSALEQAIDEEKVGLLHLQTNGAEGNVTHPLFDEAYYLRNNPQVAASGLTPLLHYRQIGAKELRNPHALFDAKFYVERHPDVLAANADPLLHFLTEGAKRRYNPNPYFDVDFYLWRNPEVEASGINPLVHFVKLGAAKGLDPSPLFGMKDYLARYPDVVTAGAEPLSHFLEYGRLDNRTFSRPLYFTERLDSDYTLAEVSDGRVLRPEPPIPVFCVYGPSNVEFIRDAVIPAFQNESTSVPVELHFVNYKAQESLLTGIANVTDWSSQRSTGHWGFGESVNYLFEAVGPERCFLLCNPDSFPMQGCLARLVETYVTRDAAIVEARQWPSAHPKEFDPETLETPWASGAFALISSVAFQALNGFDPLYFLYTEDVDLSWRAWLRGFRVIHQPLAVCGHATGLHSYRPTRFYYEHFFSLRNFLIISYKFFDELGERIAMEYLRAAPLPEELYKKVLDDYRRLKPSISVQPPMGGNTAKVKILGLNVFHELRQ